MPINHLLFTIDPFLGRLDYESLSDQALMEMLIDGMKQKYKKAFKDRTGNYLDKCEWTSLYYGPCVECIDERVTEVKFRSRPFSKKQFPFEFIPPLATILFTEVCSIHGSLDTSLLPQGLIKFSVIDNKLHGSISARDFPRDLKTIRIECNEFCGSIVLSDLPANLNDFIAEWNAFSGEISLENLPKKMVYLDLSNNNLSGPLHIEHLPDSMRHISLADNFFEGNLRFMNFPPHLISLSVSASLSGTAVLRATSEPMHFTLKYKGVNTVLDENGKTHAWAKQVIQQNEL